jgi:5-methylcytosine-specific restriction endonuclease McrA
VSAVATTAAPAGACQSSGQLSPGTVFFAPPCARVEPLAPERFALQVTISRATQEKLERAKALLGHAVPSGELAQVLDRALDALIEKLEKSRYAATDRPRAQARPARVRPYNRHIPAAVKREVVERDGHRCTFVSETGHRCEATSGLEFDHIRPFAMGGVTSAANLRLCCRDHNQYAAEQEFGCEFMDTKRERAKPAEAVARIAKTRRPVGVKARATVGDPPWIEARRGDC